MAETYHLTQSPKQDLESVIHTNWPITLRLWSMLVLAAAVSLTVVMVLKKFGTENGSGDYGIPGQCFHQGTANDPLPPGGRRCAHGEPILGNKICFGVLTKQERVVRWSILDVDRPGRPNSPLYALVMDFILQPIRGATFRPSQHAHPCWTMLYILDENADVILGAFN